MLLSVRDLTVRFTTGDADVCAVNGVSFDVAAGDTLAIVGESGSGKSQTAFGALGLLARNGRAAGSVLFEGHEILNQPDRVLNRVRGRDIGMIFQDPMSSLNPYLRIGEQMVEGLCLQTGVSRRAAMAEAARLLDAVRIPEARARLRQYPHEMSGGMRQRVMIAMSLMSKPKILIADEPTTALDVTVQAQIMALLRELRAEFGMALVLITHDLGVVAGAAERMIVLYGGQIMEQGPTDAVFARPAHPYTEGLLAAVPRLDRGDEALRAISGEPPNMGLQIAGCPFAPRCDRVLPTCTTTSVELNGFGDARARACHLPLEAMG